MHQATFVSMNKGAIAKSLNLGANISVLKSADGNTDTGIIKISGVANTPDVDRSHDIVVWSEESIKNYRSNPILLFAHDRKEPIGKCTNIEIRTEGLWIDAEIDKRWEKSYLIENETLKTLSVRFYASDYEYQQDKDVWLCKASDLLEISVEPIPDNPNATFSVAKSFDSEDDYNEFKKSFIKTTPMKELKKQFDAIMAKFKGAKKAEQPALEAELKTFQSALETVIKGAKEDEKSEIAEAVKGFASSLNDLAKSMDTEPEETTEEVTEDSEEVKTLKAELAKAKSALAKKGTETEEPEESEEVKTLKAELAKTKTALAKSKGVKTALDEEGGENPTGENKKTGNAKAADQTAQYFKSIKY